jgi:LmbE family N-acetylglucosaminyl deacetylase
MSYLMKDLLKLLGCTAAVERVVVLSPHLDDAVLSAACLLRILAPQVLTQVFTVCSAEPSDGELVHDIQSPVARRAEDRQALEQIGCQAIQLGFEDAIYRRSPEGERLYPTFASVFEGIHPADTEHRRGLVELLPRVAFGAGATLLLAPLAMGQHVDHSICAQAAVALQRQCGNTDTRVVFYEDFPYNVDQGRRLGKSDTPETAAARLGCSLENASPVPVDVDWKWSVISHYASQLSLLFPDEATGKTYLASREQPQGGQQGPVECFWQLGISG